MAQRTYTLGQDDHSYALTKLAAAIKQLRGFQRSFDILNLTYLMLVWSNEIQLATGVIQYRESKLQHLLEQHKETYVNARTETSVTPNSTLATDSSWRPTASSLCVD